MERKLKLFAAFLLLFLLDAAHTFTSSICQKIHQTGGWKCYNNFVGERASERARARRRERHDTTTTRQNRNGKCTTSRLLYVGGVVLLFTTKNVCATVWSNSSVMQLWRVVAAVYRVTAAVAVVQRKFSPTLTFGVQHTNWGRIHTKKNLIFLWFEFCEIREIQDFFGEKGENDGFLSCSHTILRNFDKTD